MLNQSIINLKKLARNLQGLDKILINQGRNRSLNYRSADFPCFQDTDFQQFSQFVKNSAIQYLVQNLPLTHNIFVAPGVEDFSRLTCRFLTQNDVWQGMVIVSGHLTHDHALDELKTEPISDWQAECDTVWLQRSWV